MKEVRKSGIIWILSLLFSVFLLSFPAEAKDVNSSASLAANNDAIYLLITNEELAPAFQVLVT